LSGTAAVFLNRHWRLQLRKINAETAGTVVARQGRRPEAPLET
jgi:hypothetical protein